MCNGYTGFIGLEKGIVCEDGCVLHNYTYNTDAYLFDKCAYDYFYR